MSALSYLSAAFPLYSADTDSPPYELSSSLKPPRGEILPSFWEQYGTWIVLAAVLVLAGIAFGVWLAVRPKPTPPVPLAVRARLELESLRQQPEDGVVQSRISQILRRYTAAVFGLNSGELTTSEFCRAVLDSQKIGPELSSEICDFLRECDFRKFAPSQPEKPLGAFARSLRIIERAEKRLADMAAASAADSNPSSAGRERGLASGG